MLAETEKIPDHVRPAERAQRRDIREWSLVTIDGEDAHDFDDAVFCEPLTGGKFRLVVCIADASHYVAEQSAIDREAARRGNSVYLPGRTLPMLPEKLSNGICSLKPDLDRLCIGCEIHLRADGQTVRYRFFEGVMRSRRRFTYDEAADIMEEKAPTKNGDDESLRGSLLCLRDACMALRSFRSVKGSMQIELPENTVKIAPGGKIEIDRVWRRISHQVIEEAMLVANCCAADYFSRARRPSLRRTHPAPAPDRVARLRGAVSALGFRMPVKPRAADFAELLEKMRKRDWRIADALCPLVLGTLRRAEYSVSEDGHFGLAVLHYLHFTSPIRRYPDLLAHRAMRAAMRGEPEYRPTQAWETIGEHCTATEHAADKLSWRVKARLVSLAARDRVGEVFDVYISGVTFFGVFLLAPDLLLEGLARLSDFSGYYRFDEEKTQLVAARSGRVLHLGQRLSARLVAADPRTGRADFAPIEA